MSTCPQVGSMFNEGIWNAQKQNWESSDIPCTMEGGLLTGRLGGVNASLCQDLLVIVAERRAGWSVYGAPPPDGEETANFLDVLPVIARCFGIRVGSAKYMDVANMWDLL